MLIFISYHSSSLALAEEVAALCREFGHEPFIAKHAPSQLFGSSGYLAGLCSTIERCDAFILCVTQQSTGSQFQKMEWGHAISHSKETPFIVHQANGNIAELSKAFPFSGSFQWCPIDEPAGKNEVRNYFAQRCTKVPGEDRFQWMQQMVIEAGLRLTARYGSTQGCVPPMLLDDSKNCATDFDLDIQDHILNALRKRYPGEQCLAEEEIEKNALRWNGDVKAEWIWTVDAIDGTLNFLAGDDRYCCGIGLLHHGQPHLGAIFLPSQMLLFAGGVGRKATVRNLRDGSVHTLHADQKMKQLDQCWTLTHVNSQPDEIAHCFSDDLPRRLHDQVRRVWMWGCGLVALAALARGTHHLFVQRVIWPWDIVPGLALVHAAGGVSTAWPSPRPEPWRFTGQLKTDVIVACNQHILDAAVEALAAPVGAP